jgi:hypothetical protein
MRDISIGHFHGVLKPFANYLSFSVDKTLRGCVNRLCAICDNAIINRHCEDSEAQDLGAVVDNSLFSESDIGAVNRHLLSGTMAAYVNF